MKRATVLLTGLVLFVTAAWFFSGCSDDDRGTNSNPAPTIVSISPRDNATGVSPATSISITFNQPMDTASVRSSFYLSGGTEMHAWMDSVDQLGGMESMGMTNMNHMIDWMADMRYGGHFNWNEALDSCEFTPDSSLMPNADHMLFLYGDIKTRRGMMMDMNGLGSGGYMYHFRTGP